MPSVHWLDIQGSMSLWHDLLLIDFKQVLHL